jgi:hemerythrin-like domain-containing protein
MCHYCGCRDMPLLRDFIAEHERAVNLGGAAVRALDQGEHGRAGELLTAMSAELESHWQGEEDGLFAAMRTDELFSQHIAPLVQEHRDLAALLRSVDLSDPEDRDRVRRAVDDLHEHIAKEEDGLFPASLTALGGEEWDAAMAAWQQAHPDRQLIADAHHHDPVAGRGAAGGPQPSGSP